MLKYRKGLSDMPAYDVAERDWRLKLNANEAPTSLPPLVEERVMSRLSRVAFNRYPNQEMADIIAQVASNYSLREEQIFFGNGSSEIIEKLFFAFGGSAVYPCFILVRSTSDEIMPVLQITGIAQAWEFAGVQPVIHQLFVVVFPAGDAIVLFSQQFDHG